MKPIEQWSGEELTRTRLMLGANKLAIRQRTLRAGRKLESCFGELVPLNLQIDAVNAEEARREADSAVQRRKARN